MDNPIDLLKKELAVLEKCKSKSIEAFRRKDISFDLHMTHIRNLAPMLFKFSKAIEKLDD